MLTKLWEGVGWLVEVGKKMESEWLFTECVFGFAAVVLGLRLGVFMGRLFKAAVTRVRRMGNRQFYCFFPTRSFEVKRS